MRLYVLFGQPKCSYEGQYGPSAISCMTEYDYEENPGYLDDVREQYKDDDSYSSTAIVVIEVSGKAIYEALNPESVVISGSVVNMTGSRE